ncbi:MAG: GHKL domain-containing protein [Lactobacillaceae bacterium]|jgi:sensor histidine kinase YesM|nr:GHKL domain-containing protein [Lactobacillaceae bacterium]
MFLIIVIQTVYALLATLGILMLANWLTDFRGNFTFPKISQWLLLTVVYVSGDLLVLFFYTSDILIIAIYELLYFAVVITLMMILHSQYCFLNLKTVFIIAAAAVMFVGGTQAVVGLFESSSSGLDFDFLVYLIPTLFIGFMTRFVKSPSYFIESLNDSPKALDGFSILSGVLLLLFLLSDSDFFNTTTYNITNMITVSVLIFVVVGSIVTFLMYYLNLQNQIKFRQQQTIDSLNSYNQTLNDLISDIRRFKHDYKNMLLSMETSIESNDINQIKKTFKSVLEEAGKQLDDQNTGFAQLNEIENPTIKSLLSAKIIEAQNKGITTNVEVSSDFNQHSIQDLDMVRLIGNLFDNAIDAAIDAEQKKINLTILESDNGYLLMLENTFAGPASGIVQTVSNKKTTKGKTRGQGMTIVAQILARYPDVSFNFSTYGQFFTQELTIGE